MRNLSAPEVRARIDRDDDLLLLDVREPWECDICRIRGSINIPMAEIPVSLATLEPAQDIVVICHHGARSLQVAGFLEQAGFTCVYNLDGGVDAWAKIIDPAMQQY